jgi:hypothetical protein
MTPTRFILDGSCGVKTPSIFFGEHLFQGHRLIESKETGSDPRDSLKKLSSSLAKRSS